MTQAIAYLSFDGKCAEAMRFYEQALHGKLEVLMSGADSPIAAQIPKEFADRILHARLALPGRRAALLAATRRRTSLTRASRASRSRSTIRPSPRQSRSSPRSRPAAG
jgi:uncharacterized glyoxalase superfamily protein PhnB